jgi:hypothetical protein
VISKGGITSHTLLAEGLGCSAVELQGQLLPGLSLVLTGPEARVPALPVLTFPGNLGDADTLRQAWQLLGITGLLSWEAMGLLSYQPKNRPCAGKAYSFKINQIKLSINAVPKIDTTTDV